MWRIQLTEDWVIDWICTQKVLNALYSSSILLNGSSIMFVYWWSGSPVSCVWKYFNSRQTILNHSHIFYEGTTEPEITAMCMATTCIIWWIPGQVSLRLESVVLVKTKTCLWNSLRIMHLIWDFGITSLQLNVLENESECLMLSFCSPNFQYQSSEITEKWNDSTMLCDTAIPINLFCFSTNHITMPL